MFALIPQLIRSYLQKDSAVLDIGAGTGNLSRSVLEAFSKACLMDFSSNIQSAAPQVLSQFEGRFETIVAHTEQVFLTCPPSYMDALRIRDRARGVAIQECCPTGFINQCLDIINLPLNRIRKGIAAVAAATSVVVEYSKQRRKLFG